MAPTLEPPPESLGADELLPFDIHFVTEQVSQVWVVMVQISPSGQVGQVGASPHDLQRLKRELEGEKPAVGWQ